MSASGALIDSHCHLDRFDPDELPALLDRAAAAGLTGLVTIGTRFSEAQHQVALTGHSRPGLAVWCTVGTHPDHVDEEVLPSPHRLAGTARPACVIGIGESGLDYFHGAPEARASQQASFRCHIQAARLAGIPLVIHARDADADIIRILDEEHDAGGGFDFLLHCFSSGAELAARALALGGSISFSGILTFPKSHALRDIAREVPPDRLLVETDAPFLAPVPSRGRRNEPALVIHTAAVLAQLRGMPEAALHELTTRNFHRLFRKASGTAAASANAAASTGPDRRALAAGSMPR